VKIEGSQSRRIEAAGEELWAMVSDVTRMGTWSPETFTCRWTGEPGPRVGATFEGCNRLRWVGTWCSKATVTRCDPGSTFGFVVGTDAERPNTEWLFTFEPAGGGATVVTETYRMIREPLIVLLYYVVIRRRRQLDRGVATTLERLDRAVELKMAGGQFERAQPSAGTPIISRSPQRRVLPPRDAWDEARHGKARILDLRSRAERGTWGWPPGARKVSLLAHSIRPDHDAIYLCQHAVRSKIPLSRGAREVEGGFRAWINAGLPVEHGRRPWSGSPKDSSRC
jgi:rhodanese-related sulfurtransferase